MTVDIPFLAGTASAQESPAKLASGMPSLASTPGNKQLTINGKPFLMRAAELQNSSLTSADYMQSIWPKLVDANINTVLGCVTWEQIEPVEGSFDFTQLDAVIQGAREHSVRLVLLWFGSFKNGMSTYCPEWVKVNLERFPRAELYDADGTLRVGDVLSIFNGEAPTADAKAFKCLMEHIRKIDEGHYTVIMVQVENEVGLLRDSRDRSVAAEHVFQSPVPKPLIQSLNDEWDQLHRLLKANLNLFRVESTHNHSSWGGAFGKGKRTDELFMAYHYALYLEKVTAAGKAAYPLPMYTNVWMNYAGDDGENGFPTVVGGGGMPGDYPSGGGVASVLDIWQLFAPSLDFIAPDIYLNDYVSSCANYRHRDQPLFIPEQRRDEYGARRIWAAYGSFQALAASPFGIDTLEPAENPYKRHYELLAKVSTHVLAAQRNPGSMIGFFFDELTEAGGDDPSPPFTAKFGPWELRIERSFVFGRPGPGYGMIIHLGGARFLLVGEGFQVKFGVEGTSASFVGILNFTEKEVINAETGEMRSWRRLNGDETRGGLAAMMPSQNPDYGSFPICVTIPSWTRIAEVEPYCLERQK